MRKLLPLAITLAVALPLGAQTKCTFTTTGQSCGPKLSGSEKVAGGTHIITLSVTNAPKTAHGLLVIGVQALAPPFQFPGSNCYLHLHPLIFVGINSDGKGRASRTFARHANLLGMALVQTGFEDLKHNQPLETSNAVKILCQ